SADPEENGSHSEVEILFIIKSKPVKDVEAFLHFSVHKEENKAEEKGNLAGERQISINTQESTDDPETKAGGKPGQQLDDDEDRKNPAYIPRKGLFFEHDVRGHTQEEERPKGRNRKLWKDEGRWEHDKFREEEQAPKSREELIAIYGYDIRNGGGPGERTYRQRRTRQSTSPNRDKRWREGGGERPVRSWQSGGGPNRGGAPSPSSIPSTSHSPSLSPQLSVAPTPPGSPLSQQTIPPESNAPPPQSHYRNSESNVPQMHPRERQGPKALLEPAGDRGVASRGGRGGGGRGGPSVVVEDIAISPGGVGEQDLSLSAVPTATASKQGGYQSASPRRQRGDLSSHLGSKQPSMDLRQAVGAGSGEQQQQQPQEGGAGRLTELDQDVARLSLAGQSWSQSPASYMRSEMRGEWRPSQHHAHPWWPPQFSSMEDMGVGSNRAKRYSSQRQRAVPEPAPPMHLGVMEGHYYEPMSYQGPIYAHGEGPAPIPPQSMLVQPEMHIPHPGLHPHQSGGPIANPTLYGAPPVSLSPGQAQQLLPPPFYPPPGVMTFPYPHGQSQVTYGGVTYYDTVQQQAQPKPSPPRRTSQPVTVKPPPPEVPFASE
uniref:Protein CASC3 n=1 Tax=Echeneis naucrates TaxID=173247 RepID=A0A665XDG8_ECHNA